VIDGGLFTVGGGGILTPKFDEVFTFVVIESGLESRNGNFWVVRDFWGFSLFPGVDFSQKSSGSRAYVF
jgi:hypothetical protein